MATVKNVAEFRLHGWGRTGLSSAGCKSGFDTGKRRALRVTGITGFADGRQCPSSAFKIYGHLISDWQHTKTVFHSPCGSVFSSLSGASLTSAEINHQEDDLRVGGVSSANSARLLDSLSVRQRNGSLATKHVIKMWACLIWRRPRLLDLRVNEMQRLRSQHAFPQRTRRILVW